MRKCPHRTLPYARQRCWRWGGAGGVAEGGGGKHGSAWHRASKPRMRNLFDLKQNAPSRLFALSLLPSGWG